MNLYLEIANLLISILYMICGALYLFLSIRYKTYMTDRLFKLNSLLAFFLIPIVTLILRPNLNFMYTLALLHLCLILSLFLGSMRKNNCGRIIDWIFGLTASILLLLILIESPFISRYTLPIHFIGILSVALSFLTLVIASQRKDSPLPKGFLGFLFSAALLSAFRLPASLQLIVEVLYACALLDLIHLQSNAIEDTFKLALSKTNKIEKDFKDAVRKEVNKHMFYHELSKEKIKIISQTDDLTKSLNKKAFLNLSEEMIRDKTPFALLMFDIDKFKTINDTLGHVAGDMCLKQLSVIAKQCIRDQDVLARYGGDEFIILLPNSDLQNAMRISERFRASVAKTEDPHFTVSIGVACYPLDAKDVKSLIQCADDGLYTSKHKGRNTVSYKNAE